MATCKSSSLLRPHHGLICPRYVAAFLLQSGFLSCILLGQEGNHPDRKTVTIAWQNGYPDMTTLAHETLATDSAALAAVSDDASATAAIWLAAKETETAAAKVAKVAKGDRDAAATVLAGMVANGDTVTVNGNARYTVAITDVAASVNGAKVLAALATLRPDLLATITDLQNRPENRNTAYTKFNLKRERK